MKLIVQLVVWNGKKYLPYLFDSLAAQTLKDWHLMILDNGSSDGSAEWLERHAHEAGAPYTFQAQSENSGFAGGHNMLFKKSRAEFSGASYVLLLNQDMYAEPDCFKKILAFAERHTDAGAFSPRLMRWNFSALAAVSPEALVRGGTDGALEQSKTNFVDTLGLKACSTRRVIDWLTGRLYSDALLVPYARRRNDGGVEVFGVSGALPLYRVSALHSALCDGNLFDPDYGSYKEDVDLAWRLRLAGWRAFTVLDAVAYHDRTAAGPQDTSDRAARAQYQKKPDYVRSQSYRNHLLTLFKNELWQNLLIDGVSIFWYELKKFGYLLVRHPHLLARAWYDIIRLLPRTFKKRREAMHHKKIGWMILRRWWDV
ncbi:MAG: Glycosyl transferase family 2 [Candidatus Magasanikbacteria bacterium GW2011_GWA2_45_39]|uniref:Glycosyl transferase family 2 n=2 Tax=Candidatus Magasanikiibacteriota TaxID=1752731 RepID=A0A0G1N0Y4_9BACT|nr:MAG: Glycosyl transferase family 2 [Candidatus Magasanikbacteria bacterium GW2011_GWA2_45_39]KKU14281.1 MAG: Glycosyl transferase family 2 [Candidatus Magasanikbacteria bacterium GW2011_GWC2_45_8]